METKNKIKISASLILVMTLCLTFVNATDQTFCEDDVAIRYSYSNSFGTGIAIQDTASELWLTDPVQLSKGNNTYEIKYYVDNNALFLNQVNITLKLNDSVLLNESKEINSSTSKTFVFNLSNVECKSDYTNYTISLEVENEGDCFAENNFASRNITILCNGEEPQIPVCGDGEINQESEECDDGNNLDCDGCSSECKIEVTPVEEPNNGNVGIGGIVLVEEFKPIVWQCDDRVLTDDYYQPWRTTDCAWDESERRWHDNDGIDCEPLSERAGNYLFEGEKYQIDVVVFDKNKVGTVDTELILNDGEYTINCVETGEPENFRDCNARIDEERIYEFDSETMQGYTCTLTALDSEHMEGDLYELTVEACDNDAQGAQCGTYDEVTPIFINPVISMGVDGGLDFSDVRPGTASYSQILLTNEAEGGVALDMFITGKNWPAADTDLGRCLDPYTSQLENYLSLGAFKYYAENGAYSTRDDDETDSDYGLVVRDVDNEGYVNINYQMETGFTTEMFDDAEILQAGGDVFDGAGYRANVLNPGAVMALTMKLSLPEPCYGDFESQEDGSLFIWAEAI